MTAMKLPYATTHDKMTLATRQTVLFQNCPLLIYSVNISGIWRYMLYSTAELPSIRRWLDTG